MSGLGPARRVEKIQTPIVPTIAGWIAENPGTVSLGQGVVHYGPPPEVAEALAAFGRTRNDHLYTPDWGMAPLVEALWDKLAEENRVGAAGRRVVVTAGANMGFLNSVLAIVDPGDEIILLGPYYFNHEMAVRLAGGQPVCVPTDGDLFPDLERIAAAVTPRTRAVVTVSPNNPTGVAYPEACLRAINDLCRTRGIFHITDEAYEYFVYDDTVHFSSASIADSEPHTIALYSFSKSFGLAGWRAGYMVIPEALFDGVMKIQDTNVICAPAVSQHAALACLRHGGEWARQHLPAIAAVRAMVLEALADLGELVTIPAANGAFYVYLKINPADEASPRERRSSVLDSLEVTRQLISDFKVAVIPGSAFGSHDACYLRVSYGALEAATVREGIGRLITGISAIAGPK